MIELSKEEIFDLTFKYEIPQDLIHNEQYWYELSYEFVEENYSPEFLDKYFEKFFDSYIVSIEGVMSADFVKKHINFLQLDKLIYAANVHYNDDAERLAIAKLYENSEFNVNRRNFGNYGRVNSYAYGFVYIPSFIERKMFEDIIKKNINETITTNMFFLRNTELHRDGMILIKSMSSNPNGYTSVVSPLGETYLTNVTLFEIMVKHRRISTDILHFVLEKTGYKLGNESIFKTKVSYVPDSIDNHSKMQRFTSKKILSSSTEIKEITDMSSNIAYSFEDIIKMELNNINWEKEIELYENRQKGFI